jgi:hypothetical protein
VFPVPIQGYVDTDFTATLTAPPTLGGAETTLTLNSNYTLVASGSDTPPEWTLTTQTGGGLTSPFPAGYTLQVFIDPTQTQQTVYVQGQQFPSLAVQTNLDRLTQMVQRLQDLSNRAIVAPDGDVAPNMQLAVAPERASQLAGFDANGNLALFSLISVPAFTSGFTDSSGVANEITVTTGGSYSYSPFSTLLVKIANTNTSQTVDINVNTLGNVAIVNPDGSLPAIGQFPAGRIAALVYNGTEFLDINGAAFLALQSSGATAQLASGSTWTLVKIGPANVIVQVSDEGGTYQDVGYRGLPINSQAGNYTTVLADRGKCIEHPSGTHTYTIAANASVAYPLGSSLTFDNAAGAGVLTIAINSDTLVWAAGGGTGSRSLAAAGIATAIKTAATTWKISGTGLS